MGAAEEWAGALASWAIPPEILAAAPEDPWAWPVSSFVRATAHAMARDTPSARRGREAVPEGGTVLDVGCGAGAASLPLCPPAAVVVGVDRDDEMLAAFAEQASARGVEHREISGPWPGVMDAVSAADVVVCHHVLYNIGDLEPFVTAMADRARNRFVIEMTAEHPRAWSAPIWRALHGIERPTRPTAEDAIEVLAELGVAVHVERWVSEMDPTPSAELVPMVRRALCLPAARDPDVAKALAEHPPPSSRAHVTLWADVP